jgi:hypothetical protein
MISWVMVVGSVGLSLVVWFEACSWCEACGMVLVLATGVTPVSLWPLVTMANLGASSCLDVV